MKELVIYQGIIHKGIQQGKREEALSFTMRLVTRRIVTVPPDLQVQIQNLTMTQLEELGIALLDFKGASDLVAWLEASQLS